MPDFQEPKEPKDSGPLELDELSDHELATIIYLERRLFEARNHNRSHNQKARSRELHREERQAYLAWTQIRQPRVLLLDGERGTGKTSILLTLVDRWNDLGRQSPDSTYHKQHRQRVERLTNSGDFTPGDYDKKIPDHVRVVGRILDFDPLPPSMPLVAGIVQAWRPIAEKLDALSGRPADCEDESETLVDLWHRLFRVAAVGWTEIPQNQNLIEQVLDREEQVQDWHCLDQKWQGFIHEILDRAKCARGDLAMDDGAIFVVMIDDVDLQVGRVRELLPALRLLYHPNVFFLIAADVKHMDHVLRSDFYGQQAQLAHHQNVGDKPLRELVRNDPWSAVLAHASGEKVFPKHNRWRLRKLSLLEFLAFPGHSGSLTSDAGAEDSELQERCLENPGESFLRALNGIKPRSDTGVTSDGAGERVSDRADSATADGDGVDERECDGVGTVIFKFARLVGSAAGPHLPGVMTYRAAEQLRQSSRPFQEVKRGAEVLARLLSGTRGDDEATVQSDDSVDVTMTGEVAALHRPGPRIPGGKHDLVLSVRPDFIFIGQGETVPLRMSTDLEGRFNFTGALVAKMLEERKESKKNPRDYAVDAFGLRWNTYLSHAWTEWRYSPPLSFAWPRHRHPRPDEVFEQAEVWKRFATTPTEMEAEDKISLWAYAWIYYQRKWLKHELDERVENPRCLKDPDKLSDEVWTELLGVDSKDFDNEADHRIWVEETIPLLARPELGFPPAVQEKFLDYYINGKGRADDRLKLRLRKQRQRAVTDACYAAAVQEGEVLLEHPTEDEVEHWIENLDEDYEAIQPSDPARPGKKNKWRMIIEQDEDPSVSKD